MKQRIVRQIGQASDNTELERLKSLAEHMKESLLNQVAPTLFDTPNEQENETLPEEIDESAIANLAYLKEVKRVTLGVHDVLGNVYKQLGLDRLISKRKMGINSEIYHTVLARIASPASKRRTVNDLKKQFDVDISLSSVYRMMDEIDDNVISKLNKLAEKTALSTNGGEIHVAFYDCTTLYFESFTESETLLKKGYSKDMKFNQPQVVLALLATTQGIPIGYQLYPGNTFEGNTLSDAISKIRTSFTIKKVIFVADSALLSKENLDFLDSQKIQYIVGSRLKSLSENKLNELFSQDGWTEIKNREAEHVSRFKEIQHENRRLVVTYSSERAIKDKKDREKAIEALMKKMKRSKDPTCLISNYGYKKYIKVNGKSSLELDEEKIARDARFDGMHAIVSNIKELDAIELKSHYKGLWEIEECFRISKHDLKFRPIYHWTENRVKAHVAMCFMSLMCSRYLQFQLRVQGLNYSVAQIISELQSVQVSIIKDLKTQKTFGLPSAHSADAKRIYRALRIPLTHTPYQIL